MVPDNQNTFVRLNAPAQRSWLVILEGSPMVPISASLPGHLGSHLSISHLPWLLCTRLTWTPLAKEPKLLPENGLGMVGCTSPGDDPSYGLPTIHDTAVAKRSGVR
jgi:hypothetical protein